jgi:integrator complex subunit 11
MEFLKAKIKQEHGIECFMPANGETATIPTPVTIPASVSSKLLRDESERFEARKDERALKRPRLLHGVLVMRDNKLRYRS